MAHAPIALIFDFGGVLMKTRTRAPRLGWDDRLGLPHGTVERVVHSSEAWRLAQIGALSMQDYWLDVARQLHISPDLLPTLEADYFSADELDLDLVAWIRAQRAEGRRVALLSNDSPTLRQKLERLGITDLFEPLVISGDIGVMKPDAAAYHIVLERLGLPASQTVFIDDMPANISGAQAVGMGALHYQDGMDLEAALSSFLNA